MTRLQFSQYLRTLVGRTYSIADEDTTIEGQFRLVVVRRGKEESLIVHTIDAWVARLSSPPNTEDRMLVKHLAICIRRYFARPDALETAEFAWPGTVESRTAVRLALDPRRRRRAVNSETSRLV